LPFRPLLTHLIRLSAVAALVVVALVPPTRAGDEETAAEKEIGRVVAPLLENGPGIETDPLLTRWVGGIGDRVGAQSPRKDLLPHFVIIGSDVANALTLPGGTVLVTRGLLDTVGSDDELASVMAHETAHVAKKHAVRQIEGNLLFSILGITLRQEGHPRAEEISSVYNIFRTLEKSREQETEADDFGVVYAYGAGYDPEGLVRFLQGFSGERSDAIERLLETHPQPEERIAREEKSPLVAQTDPQIRETMARDFADRGYPGLADDERAGLDPLAFPPVTLPTLDPALATDRTFLLQQAADGRHDMLAAYRARQVGDTLDQVLLFNSDLGDLSWDYLAAHAYAVENRTDDLYARTVRVLARAAPTYSLLATSVDSGSSAGVQNAAAGREELLQAVQRARAATKPLEHAANAVVIVLTDLNNQYLRPRGNSEPGLRLAADEGSLRYADSELARADKASGEAWHLLALAQVRGYEERLDALVPRDDASRRALWKRLATDRFGGDALGDDVDALPTGSATARSALAVQTGKPPAVVEDGRGATPWADWMVERKATPEDVATMMRILTLDLERETAAEDRVERGSK
jgi:hypothetical protein